RRERRRPRGPRQFDFDRGGPGAQSRAAGGATRFLYARVARSYRLAAASPRAWPVGPRARVCLGRRGNPRSEEHTSELQSRENLVCRLLLEKKKKHKLATTAKSPPREKGRPQI